MSHIVFFLEEPSAEAMLKGLLPRILPESFTFQCIVFSGKSDLDRRLMPRLRGYILPDAQFVVLRDKDSADCMVLKQRLARACRDGGKPGTLVRIVCTELESWYLGDLAAVEKGLGISGLARHQKNKKFRDPDRLANAKQELKRLTDFAYRETDGSADIGVHLSPEGNSSHSFNVFVTGLRRLVSLAQPHPEPMIP